MPGGTLRRFWAMAWADPETRSTTIGVAAVLLYFFVAILFGPYLSRLSHTVVKPRPPAAPHRFTIQLAPTPVARKPVKPPPPPNKFVETNPDAPENTPDKTNNFSNRNQQVAQEKPTPNGKSDRPALEGRKDIESTSIVDGRLTQPTEATSLTPPSDSQEDTTVKAPKREQNPLTSFDKKTGDNPNGFGSKQVMPVKGDTPNVEKQEGVKNAPLVADAMGDQPAIDPHHPRARPQIVKTMQVKPAIFAENKFGTQNIGNIAVDAKWSNYGAYLQKMIETVQIQWERILIESKVSPTSGTSVTVKFVMNSEGEISRIVNVDGTAGGDGAPAHACVSAITDRAPYGPWTDDMKAILGEQQDMTFTFYYQ
jgi:hypothetical protein